MIPFQMSIFYLLATFGFDTAESEPCNVWPIARRAAVVRLQALRRGAFQRGHGERPGRGGAGPAQPRPRMQQGRHGALFFPTPG